MKANQQKKSMTCSARLVAMYRDEGVVANEIYPHKHQSANMLSISLPLGRQHVRP
jgi:hypothetical protein